MKVATKLMLLVLVLATFALPLVITGPSGRPLMTLGDWLPTNFVDAQPLSDSAEVLTSANSVVPSQAQVNHGPESAPKPLRQVAMSGQMYKWQDQQGRWHFSNEKPDNQDGVMVTDLPEIKNVMKAAVNRGQNSSTMSLPDFGDAGALLQRLQRSAAGSEQ